MSFLRHGQIYRSDLVFHPGEDLSGLRPGIIVSMSLRPAIPRPVALLQSLPPLHRPVSVFHSPAKSVNHHLTRAGEFSTGTLGNFQPVLTVPHFAPDNPLFFKWSNGVLNRAFGQAGFQRNVLNGWPAHARVIRVVGEGQCDKFFRRRKGRAPHRCHQCDGHSAVSD